MKGSRRHRGHDSVEAAAQDFSEKTSSARRRRWSMCSCARLRSTPRARRERDRSAPPWGRSWRRRAAPGPASEAAAVDAPAVDGAAERPSSDASSGSSAELSAALSESRSSSSSKSSSSSDSVPRSGAARVHTRRGRGRRRRTRSARSLQRRRRRPNGIIREENFARGRRDRPRRRRRRRTPSARPRQTEPRCPRRATHRPSSRGAGAAASPCARRARWRAALVETSDRARSRSAACPRGSPRPRRPATARSPRIRIATRRPASCAPLAPRDIQTARRSCRRVSA